MANRESPEAAAKRFALLEALQDAYPDFSEFLDDVMGELGFETSDVQHDIGRFLQHGPDYLQIQAQRGQAKTTITAAFAVWTAIHNPQIRILIISAGGTQANEISTLIVRIIMTMPELTCLRPDKSAGDRTSVEAFDIHHSLKGLDKSPSVACVGITGNLQGKRASLLIADDVESQKNSRTQAQRSILLELTKDFTSLCDTGRIIYLGTPQTIDSIYNTLPGRGFEVRIWPGRYPTADQEEAYGPHLAPMIKRRMQADPSLRTGGGLLGDQGQPVDTRLGEDVLQKKERDQGPAYFQLQHMLNTKLSDADRYPLKVEQIVFVPFPGMDNFPLTLSPGYAREHQLAFSVQGTAFMAYRASQLSNDRSCLTGIGMFVDPAGGGKNGDETGYAVVGALNGQIWVLEVGGVPGGFAPAALEKLTSVAEKWAVNFIRIEKNFGNGAFMHIWQPILRERHQCMIYEDWASGQKELRIIDTLEPILARRQLVFLDNIPADDSASLSRYATNVAPTYSLFMQMARITREKGALIHDDRLDALEAGVSHWVKTLATDQAVEAERRRQQEYEQWLAQLMNPRTISYQDKLGVGRGGSNLFNKRRK